MKLHRFFILTGFILAVALIFWIGLIIYQWNRPQYRSFTDARKDYDRIAQLVMSQHSAKPEHSVIRITSDYRLMLEDTPLPMTEDEIAALVRIQKHAKANGSITFDYLWATQEYVIFWEDETKYFGLLYASAPLDVIADMKADWYATVEYHYLTPNWIEIGVFGI